MRGREGAGRAAGRTDLPRPGAISLGVAITALFARRQHRIALRRLWPALVLLLSLILLAYSET
jgi:hypothetical protein